LLDPLGEMIMRTVKITTKAMTITARATGKDEPDSLLFLMILLTTSSIA
jgi:hypothetical protein